MGAQGAGPSPISVAPYSGFNPMLGRAPYLSDLTQNSVEVNWAETTNTPAPPPAVTYDPNLEGYVTWGPAGSACNAYQANVPDALPNTVGGVQPTDPTITSREYAMPDNADYPGTSNPSYHEYQSSVELTGLSPSTQYCYRVYGWEYYGTDKEAVDLLGSVGSPTFTTLDPVSNSSTAPLTFDVLGDTGEECVTPNVVQPPECSASGAGTGPNGTNQYQSAIDSLVGQSGARFVVLAGDVGYPSGLEGRYGDLENYGQVGDEAPAVGSDTSNIFGPYYWPLTGGIPAYYADGNHGLDITSLKVWPEEQTASGSGGVYGDVSYAANVNSDGALAATYPANWYAFSTGNVRIYVLTAAWADGNAGTSSGGAYQVDADQHWQVSSAEYQWLDHDLAAHPGGIKFVIWHYPLRSYSPSETSDTYLQNSSANPDASTSVETLLAANGVSMVFDAHAHTYQRLDPSGPGQVLSYVTGGGGGVLGSVDCTQITGGLTSAYALGWDPTAGTGSACGVANGSAYNPAPPTSAAQVYNFLKVTVSGTSVTVTPTNAAGQQFDVHTYQEGTVYPGNGAYTPLTPFRLVDTRAGSRPLGPGGTLTFSVAGADEGRVPADATAAALNVTATDTTQGSYLSVYPTGGTRPFVSNVNWPSGDTVPNLTIVPLGSSGEVTAYNQLGYADLVVDLEGYFAPETNGSTAGSYVALTPTRIMDTRAGSGYSDGGNTPLGPGDVRNLQVSGEGDLPAAGDIGAVLLNVTVTDTTQPSYLTVYPGPGSPPLASNLNWSGGQTIANRVVVPLSSTGGLNLYNAHGDAGVVVDVDGYFTSPSATPPSNAALYTPIQPERVIDTRARSRYPLSGAPIAQNSAIDDILYETGDPGSEVTAVVSNVTSTDGTAGSYMTVYPGPTRPTSSDLNWSTGLTVANLTVATVGAGGVVYFYNDLGSADLVVDVFGYFTPA